MANSQSLSSHQHYTANFKLWLAFTIHQNINLHHIQHWHVIAFLQMLNQHKLKYRTILAYVSAIKHYSIKYGFSVQPFAHPLVAQMLKACAPNVNAPVSVKTIFDVNTMSAIIHKSLTLQHGQIYSAIFLLAFHAFFRISNIIPPSLAAFRLTKHLARGDIIFAPPGAHIILKWSKTIQNKSGRVIQISAIPGSILCPITALQQFISANPTTPNQPFFTTSTSHHTPTQSSTRKFLKTVLASLGIHSSATFHTFRHSGATLAFQLGVPIQHIQAHGTWQSDAIWSYLSTASTNVVPSAFASHLSL